jgi:ribosome-associated toxin RatA of RatAB toxin-antitoxin module
VSAAATLSVVPDTTHSSITISSDVATIMDVIAHVEAYPEWIMGLDTVRALTTDAKGRPLSARFEGNMGMVKDSYTVGYDWGDAEVTWHLLEGDKLTALDGYYGCTELEDGSVEVEYRLEVGLTIPVVGMLRRRGEKVIVDSALKGLKRRVEG